MAGIFLKVLNMSISASWAVLAVVILRFLLKNAPKWLNCVLWGIVGLRLIMPFSFESVLSLIPSVETISKVPDSPRPYFESGITILDSQVNDYIKGTYFEGVSKPMGNFTDITTNLSVIWIIGILTLIIYSIFSYVRLKNKISTAVILRNNIYQCETVVTPFVLGVIRPRIYLPFKLNEWDMEYVIAHEQAHVKRKDHWWKLLGFFILTLHWFNPMIWFGYIMLCRDIELACDEKVVKELSNEQRADYSQALLTCSVNRHIIAACPIAFGEVNVKNRVKSVLRYKKPAFGIILIGVIASVIVAICFLTNPITNEEAISISLSNWEDYFELQPNTEVSDVGDTGITQIVTSYRITLKDEFVNRVVMEKDSEIKIKFAYSVGSYPVTILDDKNEIEIGEPYQWSREDVFESSIFKGIVADREYNYETLIMLAYGGETREDKTSIEMWKEFEMLEISGFLYLYEE